MMMMMMMIMVTGHGSRGSKSGQVTRVMAHDRAPLTSNPLSDDYGNHISITVVNILDLYDTRLFTVTSLVKWRKRRPDDRLLGSGHNSKLRVMVTWVVLGQFSDGSDGSGVIKRDPMSALAPVNITENNRPSIEDRGQTDRVTILANPNRNP